MIDIKKIVLIIIIGLIALVWYFRPEYLSLGLLHEVGCAKKGHPGAQYSLYYDLKHGVTSFTNRNRAMYYLKTAESNGSDMAMYTLARIKERKSEKINYYDTEYYSLYRKSAFLGNGTAALQIMYLNYRNGIEQNSEFNYAGCFKWGAVTKLLEVNPDFLGTFSKCSRELSRETKLELFVESKNIVAKAIENKKKQDVHVKKIPGCRYFD